MKLPPVAYKDLQDGGSARVKAGTGMTRAALPGLPIPPLWVIWSVWEGLECSSFSFVYRVNCSNREQERGWLQAEKVPASVGWRLWKISSTSQKKKLAWIKTYSWMFYGSFSRVRCELFISTILKEQRFSGIDTKPINCAEQSACQSKVNNIMKIGLHCTKTSYELLYGVGIVACHL